MEYFRWTVFNGINIANKQVLNEIASIHLVLFKYFSNEYCRFLTAEYFTAFGVPSQLQASFIEGISNHDVKMVKKFLQVKFRIKFLELVFPGKKVIKSIFKKIKIEINKFGLKN